MSIKEQIINITISKTTNYALEAIGSSPLVTIHSIYNKTINLLISNEIFSLQPIESELSPISLITHLTQTQFEGLTLKLNQNYRLHLNYQDCAIFCTKLTACDAHSNHKLKFCTELTQQILQNSDKHGLNLLLQAQNDDLILSAFKQYLAQTEHFYTMNDEENACNILTKLIGLGIGLTPSGDDFLCGLLATFQYFNATQNSFYQKFTQQIKQNLVNTNAISNRFLDCALQQQFSLPILAFFKNLDKQNIEIEQLSKLFENIGHSSGIDTLYGIYYGCNLLSKGME
ncbi:DUF2877 domain-containing protein [Mannheimia bovis]|uniref:DUF2877 domain-containing protein n=1 Tax=Mannheimia bovis TaxID=2770636 RepID=A0A7H1C090_9PAST|nr:DUF2877 domain-containing protein [Mannheimia bovis]QNS14395.1 DUF2877 domain-containing protein [Mannheimia bovis]